MQHASPLRPAPATSAAARALAAAVRRVKRVLFRVLVQPTNRLEDDLAARPDVVHATSASPRRVEIVSESMKVEGLHRPVPGFPHSLPHLVSSVRGIRASLREVDENPPMPRTAMRDTQRHELEAFMRSAGIDAFGYVDVPPERIFQGKAILHAHAIVMAMQMDRARLDTAPSPDTAVMVLETYDRLGIAANRVARYLRARGYAAQAGHPLDGPALYPPLAQAAGLGWQGRHGLLITPGFGPRVRLAAVFTSIEDLPVGSSDEHAWIDDFCAACAKCIRRCPPGAIRAQPVRHAAGRVSCVDAERCLPYFVRHHGCSICIAVCPFHQRDYDRLRAGWMRHAAHAAELSAHPPANFPPHLRRPPMA